ncbi:MAG: ATP-dependent DNA helicase RecG [Lachnoclostridium sp.]|nr:ATP-dependent DNA helicase RecG [Lachnoclostridium sp.]
MNRLRSIDIKYLKGIGPRRAEMLGKHLDIKTYYDYLHYYPTSYVDRSTIHAISSFADDMPLVQVKGRFISFAVQGEGAKTRLMALFTDGTGMMQVVWFQRISKIRQAYNPGQEYVLFGKPTQFNGHWSMVHPEVDSPNSTNLTGGFRGVYSIPEKLRNGGFTSRSISLGINEMLSHLPELQETLPEWVVRRMNLLDLRSAVAAIHNPPDKNTLDKARLRLKFEELFYLQLDIQRYARRRQGALKGFVFSKIGYYFNTFYKDFLPFPLTGAQKRVVKEVRADVATGHQMNRLIQGDVGSGKTLVALLCMLMALDNDTQACMMAPTEILATQHYETLSAMVAPMGVKVRLLTGSTSAKARREIHESLRDGSLHILVGTHAVIEDSVEFKNLGLVVIDEQHRFGVAQRARLWKKNIVAPHVLVMTATPIPRTLAMTVYGDLDVSVIDELPPGRKPVVTLLRYEENRFETLQGVGRQLRQGRQVYIVYPLVKENEKLDLKSLEEGYETIRETFRDYRVAYVHGQMKPAEKDYQMQLFVNHEADILVATTVIEVGVNVPNATTMIIENAERFGLSQLHQLRGRVGRGEGQSFCILMSKRKIAANTRKRLELMTETTDGFRIAEADMQMRGPGDIEGTMQSGIAFDLHIANLATDGQIIQLARDLACETLDADPTLSAPENSILRQELSRQTNRLIDWSRIS